jgi:hypothetical protein
MLPLLGGLRRITAVLLVGTVLGLAFSSEACADCHEGRCECADGTSIRVASAPCQCRAVCTDHGGVCSDDYAGCPVDGGDGGPDSSDADAWPWPFDAPAG